MGNAQRLLENVVQSPVTLPLPMRAHKPPEWGIRKRARARWLRRQMAGRQGGPPQTHRAPSRRHGCQEAEAFRREAAPGTDVRSSPWRRLCCRTAYAAWNLVDGKTR